MEQWWNDDYQGKPKELGDKPVPVILCPSEISPEVTWD
jgi:hypothetical protein